MSQSRVVNLALLLYLQFGLFLFISVIYRYKNTQFFSYVTVHLQIEYVLKLKVVVFKLMTTACFVAHE